ncbi:E3 ubiquitin/ISG15 ligase TRIM25-like [Amia ocellicauda]|uniref:E3 ubiquitin/ISG15 ligase TRIM25-like n=1 Tax=Amia ocellicauda TaxID=2972642 RepID=UPI003464CD70
MPRQGVSVLFRLEKAMSESMKPEDPLEGELTCPVCLDIFRDPCLLPCGHNLCLHCVEELKKQSVGSGERLSCPECRKEHGQEAQLQKNYRLANIADEFRRSQRAETVEAVVSCDWCPEQTAAVKTCLKCEVSMCAVHLKLHQEKPAFRHHPLSEPLRDIGQRKCPEHDEMYKYYCAEEKVFACTDCTVEGKHTGHTVKSLKNMEKELKACLESRLQRAEEKLQETQEVLKKHKTNENNIGSSADQLAERLHRAVDRLVSQLRERHQQETQRTASQLQLNHSRIVEQLSHTEGIRRDVQTLLQEGDPFRLIQSRLQVLGRRICRALEAPVCDPEPVSLDRKKLLENLENKYRDFQAETEEFLMVLRSQNCEYLLFTAALRSH